MGWTKTGKGCWRDSKGNSWTKTNNGCWRSSDGRSVTKTNTNHWEEGGTGWGKSNFDAPIGLFEEDEDDDW